MNPITQIAVRELKFEGPEVTWAGSHATLDGACFGFEDGTLELPSGKRLVASPSGEAINGVAASEQFLAVSTRAQVCIHQRGHEGPTVFPFGAHGVVMTKNGRWAIAAAGPNGLAFIENDEANMPHKVSMIPGNGKHYFHRATLIEGAGGREILITANRRGGFGTCATLENTGVPVIIHPVENLDVIDVCGLNSRSNSALAVSADARLMLFGDVLKNDPPLTYQLHGIQGEIYRIMVVGQQMVLLTSQALYAWLDFVPTALEGKPSFKKPQLVLPMDAIDINPWGQSKVLIVMASNAVNIIDFDELTTRRLFSESSPRIWTASESLSQNISGELRSHVWNGGKTISESLVGVS